MKHPTLLESLERWWSDKYKLPWSHELFQEQTLEDLLTEFYTDSFTKNPLNAHRNADGEIQLTNTGDPYIDKWEAELAQGAMPDLLEVFTPEDMAKLDRLRHQAARSHYLAAAPDPVAEPRPHRETHPVFPSTFGDD